MNTYLIVLLFFVNFSVCRDFYVGMFKKNDFLVAQDRLYKERRPFRYSVAKYGRLFTCPITFFRVVDRLGIGNGPRIQINRGGLGKNYLTLIITSSYNYPVSVNIYVGCSSVKITTSKRPLTSSSEEVITEDNASHDDGNDETTAASVALNTTIDEVAATTVGLAGNMSAGNDTATTAAG